MEMQATKKDPMGNKNKTKTQRNIKPTPKNNTMVTQTSNKKGP